MPAISGLMPTGPSRLRTAPRPDGRPEIALTRASVNALIRHLRGSGQPVESREQLDALLEARPSRPWPSGSTTPPTRWWCRSLSAVRVLDVPAVVVDGTLPRPVLDQLIARLEPRRWPASPESRDPPRLVRGTVGRDAPAIGAAILPLHLNFSSSRDVLLA